MAPIQSYKTVNNYRFDIYLHAQKLANEIDENNHAQIYAQSDQEREQTIIKQFKCRCMRINPDHWDRRKYTR